MYKLFSQSPFTTSPSKSLAYVITVNVSATVPQCNTLKNYNNNPWGLQGLHFWRGLSTEGKLRFQIDWVSLVVSKFTVFALFYFVFEGNFPSASFRGLTFGGAIYWRIYCIATLGGLHLEGLLHREAYFLNFTVTETLTNIP